MAAFLYPLLTDAYTRGFPSLLHGELDLTARYYQFLISIAFSAVFLISRIWIIEGDLAPFEVSSYQKIDSFYYAGLAFEWFEGKYEPEILQNGLTALPGGVFYNICVYLSLITFGDNYFGFRLNVVFLALATSLIFAWLTATTFGLMGLLVSLVVREEHPLSDFEHAVTV